MNPNTNENENENQGTGADLRPQDNPQTDPSVSPTANQGEVPSTDSTGVGSPTPDAPASEKPENVFYLKNLLASNGVENSQKIIFFEKDFENGNDVNGTTIEEVIHAAIGRTNQLDGRLSSNWNKDAVSHLKAALTCFKNRTEDRKARKVEGTQKA